jgi:exodeoxyribonuclease III
LIHKDWVDKLVPVRSATDIGVKKHDLEGRVTYLEFEKFNLVATYVPNSGVMKLERLGYRTQEWDVDFQAFCKGLEAETGKPVVVTGDLNVAHRDIDIHGPKGKDRRAGFTP